jgi:hypothetical protein
MPSDSTQQKENSRIGIIGAVKTYLGFFVLVVLVVEAVFGAIALQTTGSNQMLALAAMLLVIGVLILVVSFFAYRRPEALLRSIGGQPGSDLQPMADFSSRIAGHWWEWIRPGDSSALSLVEIRPETSTSTVKMKGSAYRTDGEIVALWESIASCINWDERKVFYYWRGWHPMRPDEPYEGFGEISFHQSGAGIDRGVGFFSDTNLTDLKSTRKKSVEFRRCSDQDLQVMQGDDNSAVQALIQQKLR